MLDDWQAGAEPERVRIASPENGARFFLGCGVLRHRAGDEGAHEGDRPMSLHWKLEVTLPMELFRAFSVLRV